jgi:hypothetical protein
VVQTAEPYIKHSWMWRGHKINYAVSPHVLACRMTIAFQGADILIDDTMASAL